MSTTTGRQPTPTNPRPEYDRLLGDVRKGLIDVVVVMREDRLHRQPAELETFIKDCKQAGMNRLMSVKSGPTNLSDPSALLILRVKGDVAAYEVHVTTDRILDHMQELAEQGKYSGGTRPFGYEGDGITIREEEAKLIREAAQYIIEGGTLYSLVQDWNARGIPTVLKKRDHGASRR